MGDAVTSQTVLDNRDRTIMVFTNVSDGTGESAVKKVDVSALTGTPSRVFIEKVYWATSGMDVTVLEDAGTDVTLLVLGSRLAVASTGKMDFRHLIDETGGLGITEATGATGDIMFTTTGHASGDTYTIVMHLKKSYS